MRNLLFLIMTTCLLSCGKKTIPKPKAYLSLEFPKKTYKSLRLKRPYSFEVIDKAKEIDLPKNWMKIEYPALKASIDITYRPIKNNLNELLSESDKLVFEHTVKADQIISKAFEDTKKKTYGRLFEISGNAASQIQFHMTDSTKHFIKGSLFFHTKPNFDSIVPAVDYVKKDMIKIMETLKWNN